MLNFFSDISAFRVKDSTVADHTILNDAAGWNNNTHAQHRVNDLSTLADLAPSHEKGG